jgi:ABC-type amino acid transport substrate-binding protein
MKYVLLKSPVLEAIIFLSALMLICIALVGCKTSSATDASLEEVKERGVLMVGISLSYEPMEFTDSNGNIVGVDLDVAGEIARQLGVKMQVKDFGWDELFDAVKSGDADIIISTITITPERGEEMLFSIPYFSSGQVIVVRKETQNIKGVEDFGSVKVGAQENTTCEIAALNYVNDSLLMRYPDGDPQPTIVALKSGEVDAVVMDYVAAASLVKADQSLKIVGPPFTQEYYGIATRLGNNALMDKVNNALREMKRTGMLKEIEDKWLK